MKSKFNIGTSVFLIIQFVISGIVFYIIPVNALASQTQFMPTLDGSGDFSTVLGAYVPFTGNDCSVKFYEGAYPVTTNLSANLTSADVGNPSCNSIFLQSLTWGSPNYFGENFGTGGYRWELIYQGFGNESSGYVNTVASTTQNISTYFPTATSSDVTTLVEKMHTAGNTAICAQLHSPGELSVTDSKGRVVGTIDGKLKNDFPLAISDKNAKLVKILSPEDDSYSYKVVGTGSGTYGLDITFKNGNQETTFKASDIAMLPNEVHSYTVDKNALLQGQDGVTVTIDRNGDGITDRTIKTGMTLTGDTYNSGATTEELQSFKLGDVPTNIQIQKSPIVPEGKPSTYISSEHPQVWNENYIPIEYIIEEQIKNNKSK